MLRFWIIFGTIFVFACCLGIQWFITSPTFSFGHVQATLPLVVKTILNHPMPLHEGQMPFFLRPVPSHMGSSILTRCLAIITFDCYYPSPRSIATTTDTNTNLTRTIARWMFPYPHPLALFCHIAPILSVRRLPTSVYGVPKAIAFTANSVILATRSFAVITFYIFKFFCHFFHLFVIPLMWVMLLRASVLI